MAPTIPHVLQAPIRHRYLQATWDFIRKMERKQRFKISSASPLINGVSVEVNRTERGYAFEAAAMNYVPGGRAQYQDKGYGFFDEFLLKKRNATWCLPEGVTTISTAIISGTSDGLLGQVNNRFDNQTPVYHRLVLRQNLHHQTLARHIESHRVQVGSTYRGGGLVNVIINECQYLFYDFSVQLTKKTKSHTYYFIDSTAPVLYAEFEKAIGAIVYASAFVTGELPREEMYIVQAEDPFFYVITGAQYRQVEQSVDSKMEVVAPMTMRNLKIGEPGSGYVTEAVLSTLASRAYNDVRMLRALKIVVESGLYPLEIRGATYSVALETVKEIVLESFQDAVKPFKEKAHARSIIKQLKAIVEADEDVSYNDKKMVLIKLDNLNTTANSAGFASCFTQLGVQLNERDAKVLNNRNDFLHGRIPFENEFKDERNHELQHIVYRYHFLLSVLILKFCGYSGYIKNNATFYNAIARRTTETADEPLFRRI